MLLGHVMGLQARSVAIWGVVLGAFGVMMVAIFPGIASGPGLQQMTDALPKGMMQAAGVEDMASLGTIKGFLEAEIFGLILPLALPFFAILAAAGAIAGAEENGTIDVLMGNPLSRPQLVTAYFVSIAVSLAGILAIFGLFLWGAALFIDAKLPLGAAAEGVFGAWPLSIMFGGLALLLASAIFHRKMVAVGISGAILVAMYFMDALGGMVEKVALDTELLGDLLLRLAVDRGHGLGELRRSLGLCTAPRRGSGLRLPKAATSTLRTRIYPKDLQERLNR